jgi:hypothetical protein
VYVGIRESLSLLFSQETSVAFLEEMELQSSVEFVSKMNKIRESPEELTAKLISPLWVGINCNQIKLFEDTGKLQ